MMQHLPSVQWNRGTYDYQNPDGTVSRLQGRRGGNKKTPG